MNQQNLRKVIKSSKTTEIYTHLSAVNLAKTKNPLDQFCNGVKHDEQKQA